MIHIAIGTTAQFIMMSPVIRTLQTKGVPFNLIDLGQHSLVTTKLRKEFNLDAPAVSLSQGRHIATVLGGLAWTGRIFIKGLSARFVRDEVFQKDTKGVCIIHGETLSTLLGLYLAKRAGLCVAHLESGFRSFNCFEPFPEEIFRILILKSSDMLFAPSQWAFNNLQKMRLDEKAQLLSANTSLESVSYSLSQEVSLDVEEQNYCLVTLHRMENIYSRKRLTFLIETLTDIAQDLGVVFIQHPPTINRLRRYGLDKVLEKNRNIHIREIISHSEFIHLMHRAQFVISDGGSVQEECFYLDKPCLLLRRYTERMVGLGENIVLSELSPEKVKHFLDNYADLKRTTPVTDDCRPSEEIIEHVRDFSNG